jgi:hypothetical protein
VDMVLPFGTMMSLPGAVRVIRSSAMASIVGGTFSECSLMTSSNLVKLCRG